MSDSALKFYSPLVFPMVDIGARGSAVAHRLVVRQAGFSACFHQGNGLRARLLGTHLERVSVWKNESAAKFHNSVKNQHVDSNQTVCTVTEGKPKNAVGCLACARAGLRPTPEKEGRPTKNHKHKKPGPLQGPSFVIHRRLSRLHCMGFRYPKFSVRSNGIHRGFATGLRDMD